MRDIICIYHGNCADGFGAAWAVWKRCLDAKFHAGVYGEEPPDVKGKAVVLVDFSYSPDVLAKMSETAASILILDHHKSTIEAITSCERIGSHPPINAGKRCPTFEQYRQQVLQDEYENVRCPVYYLFDMDRSGAMIAYEFFHSNDRIPQLIHHIQDRDLWLFKIGRTREVQANLFSHPYDFKVWDDLMFRLDDPDEHMKFVAGGIAIERKHLKDVEELVNATKREMCIGGYWVWVANLPYTMASDACHLMCKMDMYPKGSGELTTTPPFAASYYDKPDGRVFSLRSIGDFDVSEIAKKYGGGGHKNAAGFTVPIGWCGD